MPGGPILRAGALVAGRFKLVSELGRGGMGHVWLAQHVELDVPCAVKFVNEGMDDPATRTRFNREAKAAARLRSPNVVQILDQGVWEDVPYIAMELLEGEDLRARLDRLGKLSRSDLFPIVSQVGRALDRAHSLGIVHRDLKPENVFLAHDHDREVVKILDFGVAKMAATSVTDVATKTGTLLGTPYYMSPEQTRGTTEVDGRSDLWSLAVITYEALVGARPFESTGLGELMMAIMHEPLPVPSATASWLPHSFDQWWARAATRDPAGRYATASEMVDALADALGVRTSGAVQRDSMGIDDTATGGMRSPYASDADEGASAKSANTRIDEGARTISMPLGETLGGVVSPPPKRATWMVAVGGVAVIGVVATIAVLALRAAAPPPAPISAPSAASAPAPSTEASAASVPPSPIVSPAVSATPSPSASSAPPRASARPTTAASAPPSAAPAPKRYDMGFLRAFSTLAHDAPRRRSRDPTGHRPVRRRPKDGPRARRRRRCGARSP